MLPALKSVAGAIFGLRAQRWHGAETGGRMGAVIVIVAIWVTMIVFEPLTHVRLGLGSMALGYVLAWYEPIWFKHRHVKSQNRLLDRCRALLILGSRAIEAGDKTAAERALLRIRRLESLWKLGNAIPLRVSLALWAIAWGVAASVAIRFGGLLVVHYGWTGKLLAVDKVLSELWVAALISGTAPLYALMGYFEAWVNPWAIENCGDRLWQIIYGSRGVEPVPKRKRNDIPEFEGMTPRGVRAWAALHLARLGQSAAGSGARATPGPLAFGNAAGAQGERGGAEARQRRL